MDYNMTKNAKFSGLMSYPHLWRWLTEVGTVEIGPRHQTRSFIRVLDEGGMIWKGRRSYRSLDTALADADAGVAKWMKKQGGIADI
jgi:hypothetical protein